MEEYKLVPEAIPSASGAVYERILDDFLVLKEPSCRVEVAKRKPGTIQLGLSKTRKANPRFAGIKVVRRGDLIYLKR